MWDITARKQRFALTVATPEVRDFAFSPDGAKLAACTSKETEWAPRIWDTTTGQELTVLKSNGKDAAVWHLAFSPDGHYLATGGEAGVKLWNAATGVEVRKFGDAEARRTTKLLFSPDGTRLIEIAGVMRVHPDGLQRSEAIAVTWNVATGKKETPLFGNGGQEQAPTRYAVKRTTFGLGHTPHRILFTPDGNYLVAALRTESGTSSSAWEVCQLDARTGRHINWLRVNAGKIERLALSPDGRRVAMVCEDKTVREWHLDVEPQDVLCTGHQGPVTCMAFSGDGTRLVTGGYGAASKTHRVEGGGVVQVGYELKVWNTSTGKEVLAHQPLGRPAEQVVFSPDGRLLAAGGMNGTIGVWEARTRLRYGTLRADQQPVKKVAVGAGGSHLASLSADGQLRVWDVARRTVLWQMKGSGVTALAFCPSGEYLAFGDGAETPRVHICRASDGHRVRTLDVKKDPGLVASARKPVSYLAYGPKGSYLACGTEGAVTVLDPVTGQERLRISEPRIVFSDLMISPDGKRLAGHGHIWDLENGKILWKWNKEDDFMALTPDGPIVSVGGREGFSIHPERAEKQGVSRYYQNGPINSLTFSPDGLLLAGTFSKLGVFVFSPNERLRERNQDLREDDFLQREYVTPPLLPRGQLSWRLPSIPTARGSPALTRTDG